MGFVINNFKVIKNLITPDEVEVLKICTEIMHRTNLHNFDFKQSNNADSFFYGSVIGDSFLLKIKPIIEKEVDHSLLPTYSFFRIYTKFSRLDKHQDRPSCELSVTLHIASDKNNWPIFMGGEEVVLSPGDAVIYKGTEIPHWRNEFTGDYYSQVFLHYVKADGKYKDHYKDKRPYFGVQK